MAELRIADRDPANIECVMSGGAARIDVVAQASPRAWTTFDTLVAHQAQVFGSGAGSKPADLPQDLGGLGYNAAWIAAESKLIATNGTPSRGGSFVTITVRGVPSHRASKLKLAQMVSSATLRAAPRGPDPGPPPS